MKKNGFTLIELLATIIVLGIISLIAFPLISDTISDQKEKLYKRQVATIVDATKALAAKNTNILPDDRGQQTMVSIDYLIKKGMIEGTDVIDPKTSSKLDGCVRIQYNSLYTQYEYEFINREEINNSHFCNEALNQKGACSLNSLGIVNCLTD